MVSVGGGGLVAGLAAYAKIGGRKEGSRRRNAGRLGGREDKEYRLFSSGKVYAALVAEELYWLNGMVSSVLSNYAVLAG